MQEWSLRWLTFEIPFIFTQPITRLDVVDWYTVQQFDMSQIQKPVVPPGIGFYERNSESKQGLFHKHTKIHWKKTIDLSTNFKLLGIAPNEFENGVVPFRNASPQQSSWRLMDYSKYSTEAVDSLCAEFILSSIWYSFSPPHLLHV